MGGTVNEIFDYLRKIDAELARAAHAIPEMLSDAYQEFSSERGDLQESILKHELLVPVVGAFSAGKSTLINRSLGVDYLPVKVTPETALPCEIRYSQQERVEAIRGKGQVDEYPLASMDELTARAEEYEYARLYVNNAKVKELEPFVLVDMPGYDSPHDAHNKAILRYLSRGVYYFFLVSVEEGGLSSQAIRRMSEIETLGRNFGVLLTKSDLKPSESVREIKAYVEDQLSSIFGPEQAMTVTGEGDSSALLMGCAQLDSDAILFDIYQDRMKNLYFSIDGVLNAAIAALKNDEEKNVARLKEMEKARDALCQERERAIRHAQTKVNADTAGRIVGAVENALNGALDELSTAATAGQGHLSRLLSDIVRSTLLREFQSTATNLGAEVARGMAGTMSLSVHDFEMREDWIDTLIGSIRTQVMEAMMGLEQEVNRQSGGGISGTLLALGAAISKAIPHPVLKVVVAILPSIVGQFFESLNESRQQEKIRSAIINKIIPDVLRQTRPTVNDALTVIAEQIVNAVEAQFANTLAENEDAINNSRKQVMESAERRAEQLSMLESCRTINRSLVTSVVYKEAA